MTSKRKGDTHLSIIYFFERIHQKGPIAERVRWDAAENSDESQGGGLVATDLKERKKIL
jgi:hypothetical protein